MRATAPPCNAMSKSIALREAKLRRALFFSRRKKEDT